MREITGNLWDYINDGWIVITTNGIVNAKGGCVMGRGTALQAKRRYPGLDIRIGNMIKKRGNHVWIFDMGYDITGAPTRIVTFPVKHHWQEPADLQLIAQSAKELKSKLGSSKAYMPRPGCGNGGLSWDEVRPILVDLLDDRFTVVELNP